MNSLRTSDTLEALKADLRALRSDLREIARDVGDLTSRMERSRRLSVGNWLGRAAGWGLRSDGGREETLARLREQGERSTAALRSTVQDYPMTAILGALAAGLVVAWLLTRPSVR